MPRSHPTAVVVEESYISFGELARCCNVHAEQIIAMIDEGILEPQGAEQPEWRFPGSSVHRVTTVLRLQQDLAVNLAGAALAIELMDELEELRGRVHTLERLLFNE